MLVLFIFFCILSIICISIFLTMTPNERKFRHYIIIAICIAISIHIGFQTFNYRKYNDPTYNDYKEGYAKIVFDVNYKNDTTYTIIWKGNKTGLHYKNK